jgi:cephalosporin hydroxylase
MNKLTLDQIHKEHDGNLCDKWQQYLWQYERLFASYRSKPITLLEIGVQNGGSLEVYSKCFTNAKHIIGIDINPSCLDIKYHDERIRLLIGDATHENSISQIKKIAPNIDIVIDDGSHTSRDIINTFIKLFPLVNNGGLYIIEDLHASYWSEYGGGLFNPYSSMSFFKQLTDVINYEHWGMSIKPSAAISEILQSHGLTFESKALWGINSIEFMNSLCAVHKQAPECNKLGLEKVSGTVAAVVPDRLTFDGAGATAVKQDNKEWSQPLSSFIQKLKAQLSASQSECDGMKVRLRAIEESTCWRISYPLRMASTILKSLLGRLRH